MAIDARSSAIYHGHGVEVIVRQASAYDAMIFLAARF
jgi:hypothetical protein